MGRPSNRPGSKIDVGTFGTCVIFLILRMGLARAFFEEAAGGH